jgi:glycosyltransferase involved in cell wall biosynthesis
VIFREEYDFLIVTPVLNAKKFISDCIESVKTSFDGFHYCHIIVDGGSTDGTIETIQNLFHSHLNLLHQPKSSMYEAINFGINSKKAKYFYQLNADDLVLPHAPGLAKKLFEEDPSLAVVSGAAVTLSLASQRCRIKFSLKDQFSKKRIGCNLFISQPSTFVRWEVLQEVSGYDEQYRYASDTELWLRLIDKNFKCKIVDEIFSVDRIHDGSARLLEKHITELKEVRHRYYPKRKNLLRKTGNSVLYSSKQLFALASKKGEWEQNMKYVGTWHMRVSGFFFNSDSAALELNYPFFKGRFYFWGRLN